MNDFSNNNNNSTYFNNTPQAAPRFGVGVRRVNEEQNFNMSFEGFNLFNILLKFKT